MDTDYILRPFADIADHEQCESVQEAVWGRPFIVPANMTVTLQRHGGVAIGAFDAQRKMIGFVVGFLSPARHEGANRGLSHHSHIAAVLPEWQGRGVGEALKRAQGEAVLAQGINLITWTFDPLEARNARLNIGKLGCICRTYLRNVYGDMRDALNAGLPSDRFEVEWWLDKRIDANLSGKSDSFLIQIPRDFQALKKTDINAAQHCRLEMRERFERAFADGYVVVAFTLTGDRAFYTLTRLR